MLAVKSDSYEQRRSFPIGAAEITVRDLAAPNADRIDGSIWGSDDTETDSSTSLNRVVARYTRAATRPRCKVHPSSFINTGVGPYRTRASFCALCIDLLD